MPIPKLNPKISPRLTSFFEVWFYATTLLDMTLSPAPPACIEEVINDATAAGS
jgi:hypothetical protein